VNRFQFVSDHQRHYGVKRLCQVIGLARSSYYHWKATATDRAARAADDADLAARIRVIHYESAAPTASRGSPPNCTTPDTASTQTCRPGHARHRITPVGRRACQRDPGPYPARLMTIHTTPAACRCGNNLPGRIPFCPGIRRGR
jgi:hypothetical protein